MSKEHSNTLFSVVLGVMTATSIGTVLFQALGALLLGIIGGLGGYLFTRILKPWLDTRFQKKNNKEA